MEATSANSALLVRNPAVNGTASVYQSSGPLESRVESHHLTSPTEHRISTSSSHPIRIQANRLNSAVTAIEISTDNSVTFGSAVDVAGALSVQGTDIVSAVGSKQPLLGTLAGTGVPLQFDQQNLRRIYGSDGIAVSTFLDPANEFDERNNMIRVSGAELQSQLQSAIDGIPVLDGTSQLSVQSLTADAVSCTSLTASGPVTVQNLLVADSVNHLSAFVYNSSTNPGAHASYKLQAAGSGVMQYVSAVEYSIGTDNAIPIRPNRFAGGVTALSMNTDSTCTFGGRATMPSLTVAGEITCASLAVQGADVIEAIAQKQDVLTSSSRVSVDRLTANLFFSPPGAWTTFVDGANRTRVQFGDTDNRFLYRCVMPALQVVDEVTDGGAVGNPVFEVDSAGACTTRSLQITSSVNNVICLVKNDGFSGGFASYYLEAGGVIGQQFVGASVYFIGTNSAHPIAFRSNRFTSGSMRY